MFEEMEMPTPCQHCGETFDLTDGYASEKWHPNRTICENCYREEESEIEQDDYYDNLNIELSNALYEIDQQTKAWERLDPENQRLILALVKQRDNLI